MRLGLDLTLKRTGFHFQINNLCFKNLAQDPGYNFQALIVRIMFLPQHHDAKKAIYAFFFVLKLYIFRLASPLLSSSQCLFYSFPLHLRCMS